MNKEKVDRAISFLKSQLSKSMIIYCGILIQTYGKVWHTKNRFHFIEGASIRNFMRENGYGEEYLEINNLDDYYTKFIECVIENKEYEYKEEQLTNCIDKE